VATSRCIVPIKDLKAIALPTGRTAAPYPHVDWRHLRIATPLRLRRKLPSLLRFGADDSGGRGASAFTSMSPSRRTSYRVLPVEQGRAPTGPLTGSRRINLPSALRCLVLSKTITGQPGLISSASLDVKQYASPTFNFSTVSKSRAFRTTASIVGAFITNAGMSQAGREGIRLA
jgi:hypothetical protein